MSPRKPALLWLTVFGSFVLLYGATCQRGIGWQDSGRYQWRALEGDYAGMDGIALAHPLYIFMASMIKELPFGSTIYKINLLSSIGMAFALANLALLLHGMTRNPWIALLGAATLGVMHTVWWLSTIAEVYTWNAALLTLELLVLVRLLRNPSRLAVAGLFLMAGLDFSIHDLALLSLPVYGIVLWRLIARKRLPVHTAAIAVGSFLAGGVWIIALTVQEILAHGARQGLQSMLFGNFILIVLNLGGIGSFALANAAFASLNFASFVLPSAIIGIAVVRRRLERDLAVSLLGLLGLHAVFVARYFVPDQFTFLIPTLTLVVLFACIGADRLWEMATTPVRRNLARAAGAACVALPPLLYLVAPALVGAAGVSPEPGARHPYRDEVRYWIQPWKQNEDSAEMFAVNAMSWLERNDPHSIVLADPTSRPALQLAQKLYGLGPHVLVEDQGEPLPDYDVEPGRFKEKLDGRGLYVVSGARRHLSPRLASDAVLEKVPEMVLYKLAGWRQ